MLRSAAVDALGAACAAVAGALTGGLLRGGGSVSEPRVPQAASAIDHDRMSKLRWRRMRMTEKWEMLAQMNDSEFARLADLVLQRIEAGLDTTGADLDFAMVASGVLEIEFAERSKIIVNRHAAAKEIWVAARSGGFHFRWDGEFWRDTRDGGELFVALSALVSAHAGERVEL